MHNIDMDYASLKLYLLSKPEAVEDYPFGPDVAVYKIKEKMFATLATEKGIPRTNLKCDPAEAIELRDVFDAVRPGYHMNKRHWNTLVVDGSLPDGEIQRQIDNSYSLVVKGLKKDAKTGLELRHGRDTIYRT